MSLLKKLAGETAIYGTSSILSRLLHYVILTPYFTNVFTTGQYGVVSDMYTYAALLLVLFTYRMETAFFRFGTKNKNIQDTFSTASISLIISTITFSGIMIAFAQPLANLLQYPDHADYVMWFALIIAFDALSAIPFARLRLENKPIRFAVIKTLNILVNIFFLFFFLEGCPILIRNGWTFFEHIFDAENRIAYVFISNLLASGAVILFLLPQYFDIKFKFDKNLWKEMLNYSLPLVIVGIAGVINQLISLPMLKYLLGGNQESNLSQVGIYSAAAKLAVLMNLFTQAFNYAAEPFFFRNAERSDSRVIYAQVGQAFALVGSFAFLGIMMYLDIIQLFIGRDFRTGLEIVPILLIAYLFLGLYYNFSIWYKLTNNTKIGAYISLGGSAITLSMNIFLIPVIGYMAPAWAALSCYAFMAAASYVIGRKYYPINYPIGKIGLYIGLAITCYLFSNFCRTIVDGNLVITLAINTGILLFYTFVIYQIEKKLLKPMLFK